MLMRIIRKLFIEHSTLQGLVAHTPHGMITVFLTVEVHPFVGLMFGGGFVVYEVMHEWRLRDNSWNDLAGWMLGMAICGIIYWIMEA